VTIGKIPKRYMCGFCKYKTSQVLQEKIYIYMYIYILGYLVMNILVI